MVPTYSPLRSAHTFHEANSVAELSHAVLSRSHQSATHASKASSDSRYASVASITALAFPPLGEAADHPVENAGPFRFELIDKLWIAFVRGDGDGERQQLESALIASSTDLT